MGQNAVDGSLPVVPLVFALGGGRQPHLAETREYLAGGFVCDFRMRLRKTPEFGRGLARLWHIIAGDLLN